MMFQNFDIFIGLDVLASERAENGSITIQTGDAISGSNSQGTAEVWGPYGVASIPPRADAGSGACQAAIISGGDRDLAIGFRDTRGLDIYGNLSEGATCIYAGGPLGTAKGRVNLPGDGSVSLLTEDADGNGVCLRLAPDGLTFRAAWGKIDFNQTGFHLTTMTGARFDLGSMSLPGPLSAILPSYCRITAGMVSLTAPSVLLGSGPVYSNALMCTPVNPPLGQGVPYLASPAPAPGNMVVGIASAPGAPVTGPTTMIGSTGVLIGL